MAAALLLLLLCCFRPPSSDSPVRPGLDDPGALATPAPWYPGDPIPGWDDYECEPPGVPDYVIPQEGSEYRLVWMGRQLAGAGKASVGLPSEIYLSLYTCEFGVVCYPEYDADRTGWGLFVHAFAGADPPPPAPRGLGWYEADGSCALPVRRDVFASFSDAVISIDWRPGTLEPLTECADTWTIPAEVSVCFSRIRPDQMIGSAWFRILTWSEGGYADEGDSALFEVPFQVDFPEHGGTYADAEHEPGAVPDDIRYTQYVYFTDQPYGKVWPWGDITDPVVREYVRERYRPWHEEEDLAAAAAKGD